MPRAIMAALVIVTTVYVVVTVAALGAQPWRDFAGQKAGLPNILDTVTSGRYWGTVFVWGRHHSVLNHGCDSVISSAPADADDGGLVAQQDH